MIDSVLIHQSPNKNDIKKSCLNRHLITQNKRIDFLRL